MKTYHRAWLFIERSIGRIILIVIVLALGVAVWEATKADVGWDWYKDLGVPLLAGVFTGVIATFALFHGLSPKLIPSERVSEVTNDDEPGCRAYRVKFENPLWSTITEVSIVAELQIYFSRRKKWETTHLQTSFDGKISYLPPRRALPWRKRTGVIEPITRRVVRISAKKERQDDQREFARDPYPEDIQQKAQKGTLTLRNLLELAAREDVPEAQVLLIVTGTHGFSGVRKLCFN